MEYLYRYRKFNQNTIREIVNEELYFSLPFEFNDPFDCRPFIDMAGSIDDYKLLYKKALKLKHANLYESEIEAIFEREFNEENISNSELLMKFRDSTFSELLNQVYVCCFSELKDDILMYSHYTVNHTGLCLEYRMNDPAFNTVEKVEYQNDRPTIKFIKGINMNLDKYIKLFLLTKSKHWGYENEWRILGFPILKENNKLFEEPIPLPVENRIKKLETGSLTGIILGCNMNKINIEFIKQLVSLKNSKVKLYIAVQDEKEYKVNIKQIN